VRRLELARHTIRAMPWQPQGAAGGLALAFVATDTVPFVVATILMTTAGAFCLDDPAHEVTAASSTSLVRRRLWRILIMLTPTSMLWATLMAWQAGDDSAEAWALALMYFGLTGLSLGIAGSVARRTNGHSGQVAAPTVLVLIILSSVLNPHWRPLPLGDIPGGWPQIYLRWGLAGFAGLALLAASSRDPARRGFTGKL
jgi:hypothetical protein